ncbi:antA/AntB antirepressor family protein [Salmonella enterica]|nr:antA/AntB antirepressor family protein [Salmonella enterica]
MRQKDSSIQGHGLLHPENSHKGNFAEIIPVISGVIGSQKTSTVSARALHKALGVGRDFTNWIKRYGFIEGVDYIVVENLSSPKRASSKSRQQTEHDYLISLSMGKEAAMVERTEQGRAVRHYFIKCEEELRKKAPEQAAALRRELKARITVASYFKPMCAALELQLTEQGKATQQHNYTTEANMLACIVLDGMTAIAIEKYGSEEGLKLAIRMYREMTDVRDGKLCLSAFGRESFTMLHDDYIWMLQTEGMPDAPVMH